MKKDIGKNVLNTIKGKTPRSRFAFLAKNYAFWIAGIFSIIIGAITVSVMMFIFANHEWALAGRASGLFTNLAYILPYFWFIIFILFIVITYYEIRHVRGGYKIALPIIIGVYIVSTFLLGFGLYKIGIGNIVEESFVQNVPLYHRMAEPRQRLFQHPEEGLLIGKVLNISEKEILLLDLEEKNWEVDIENAHIPPHMQLESLSDRMIVVFGEDLGGQKFQAEGVRPHMLPGRGPGMMQRVKGMKEIHKSMRIIE
ncbi:hypothetical protein HOF40_03195 [Candidatus Parcubacteria bacterium]|jgi:hypothetical protein|nr:hypothetical protein [Candidatus Parcubacteria bacterium]MBT3949067.1 hypothetical protein [Candidatus Parcubacteria bacterium]